MHSFADVALCKDVLHQGSNVKAGQHREERAPTQAVSRKRVLHFVSLSVLAGVSGFVVVQLSGWFLVGNEGMRALYKPLKGICWALIPSFSTKSQGVVSLNPKPETLNPKP